MYLTKSLGSLRSDVGTSFFYQFCTHVQMFWAAIEVANL